MNQFEVVAQDYQNLQNVLKDIPNSADDVKFCFELERGSWFLQI